MSSIIDILKDLWLASGFSSIFSNMLNSNLDKVSRFGTIIMLAVACALIYLAVVKQFEPMLLLPIAFGMLLVNLPITGLMDGPLGNQPGGLLYYLSLGVQYGVYPCLIFLGIGAMTDFGPLIANPASLFLGAAAQLGIYTAYIVAGLFGFTALEAASIGIIGGADGPTAIYLTTKLAPDLLPAIAVAAYSYMALIPLIQPPLMRMMTTKKEREVKMAQLREVSKTEKIVFPIIVTIFCSLLLPSVAPLIGMLMLGNLFRETGVVERLNKTAQNELINIVTIFLGLSVGAKTVASKFLSPSTLIILGLGLFAFIFSTIGGLVFGKLLCYITKGKINPLIGSAGVSAVPMAARISQKEGLRADPSNHLLMHAMGPNVAGVIGSAVAAGFLLALLK